METNEELHASFSMVIDSLTLLKMQLSDVQSKIKNIEKVVKKELKKTNKSVINKNKEKKMPSGFAQPANVTKELTDFMDKPYGTKIARTQATKAVIDYIKAQKLQDSEINKIIITRPMIAIEENMGFLPGDIKEKMHPWTIPIFDIFEEYYSKKEINSFIADNVIEIAPLGFMQGRTFKNSIIIADEMQNSSPNQMFMLLTRIGDKSKMIITGDPMQTVNTNNGLNDIVTRLDQGYYSKQEMYEDSIDIIRMKNTDIQRHHIVSKINILYGNS